MDATLSQFNQEFMELVNFNASESGKTIEDQFTEEVIDYIVEEGSAANPEILRCENTKCTKVTDIEYFRFDAYDYSETSGILDLFITLHFDAKDLPNITKTKIEQCHNSVVHFLSNCFGKDDFSKDYIASNPAVAELIEMIQSEHKSNNISLLRFFIISNGVMRIDYEFPTELSFPNRTYDCEFYVWDMETIRKCDLSARHEGAIDIDLANYYQHRIECLELTESDGVKSYLAIMPALILAKIYKEHKGRLLNQNVRNYLGGRIKVNKGMAETLRKSPGLFFAYNNGISSTATSVVVETENETGRKYITNLRNWQIVNGGQTTNTIYSVFQKSEQGLENVYVTMKVSEIRIEDEIQRGQAISNIARYANTQNLIKESDLSANISYMINLEGLSRSEKTPFRSIHPDTKWFFERMRGQYDVAKGNTKSADGKKFMLENPKNQKFLKSDVAKWELSWQEQPYIVSRGNELCYEYFYKNILKIQEPIVDVDYYHTIVAKGILYRYISDTIKGNGVKAYANIITSYVMASLSIKSRGNLDFDYIWTHQCVHPAIRESVLEIANVVIKYIESLTQKGENPAVKAKNQLFWNDLKLRISGTKDLDKNLLSVVRNISLSELDRKKLQMFAAIPMSSWEALLAWGNTTRKLSLLERRKIDHYIMGTKKNSTIDENLKVELQKLYEKSKDLGFNE